ncbi:hypothetical protein ACKKBF_B35520 [Auxenochlorella protothecoides x Auxenochlorella symbiontica]
MARTAVSIACLLVVALAIVARADEDSPLVKVRITGHLGDFTPFDFSGTGDFAVDPDTKKVGVATASALGVNDFKLWLVNGENPVADSDATASADTGALVLAAAAQAIGQGDTQVKTFTGTFP